MLRFVLLAVLVAAASAQGYGHARQSYAPVQRTYGHAQNSYQQDYAEPTPYKFSYDIKDGYNGGSNRQESGDGYGNVQGSYGYTDGYGIYRQVEYTADDYGFRANIKTNEPGTDNQNPADVEIYADPVQVKEAPKRSYAPVKHQAVSYAPARQHQTVSYAPVKHQTVSYAPARQHQRVSYAPVKHERVSYAPVKHERVSYAPVKHQQVSYAPVKHERVSYAPVRKQTGYGQARRY